MICAFCQQDVNEPCHNIQEIQQRAERHVERCEHALEQQGGRHPLRAPSGDVESGGKQ